MSNEIVKITIPLKPLLALFQNLYERFYRFIAYTTCSFCKQSKIGTEVAMVGHKTNRCRTCFDKHKNEQLKKEKEERIQNHIRDLQEREEARLRFEATKGVYRGK